MRKFGIAICMSVIVSANAMNYDVQNGFVGMGSDTILKLLKVIRNEPSAVRTMMGSCQEISLIESRYFFRYVYSRQHLGVPRYYLASYKTITTKPIVSGDRDLMKCVACVAPRFFEKAEKIRIGIDRQAKTLSLQKKKDETNSDALGYCGPTMPFDRLFALCLYSSLPRCLPRLSSILETRPIWARQMCLLKTWTVCGVILKESSAFVIFPGTRFCVTTIPHCVAHLSGLNLDASKDKDRSKLLVSESKATELMKKQEFQNLVHQLLPKHDPKADQKLIAKTLRKLSPEELLEAAALSIKKKR